MPVNTIGNKIIVHNFNRSTFLRAYIPFLYGNFDYKQHVILTNSVDLHDKDAEYPECFKEFTVVEKQPFKIQYLKKYVYHLFFYLKKLLNELKLLKKADLIISHSFRDLRYYILCPSLLKKTVWCIWGYDLYDYRERNLSIKTKILYVIKKSLVKKIPYVCTNIGDYDLLQKWYGVSPICLSSTANYGNGSQLVEIKSTPRVNDSLHILLNHSADQMGRHIEALDILSRFKDENIVIYIPLTYGKREYAKTVSDYARLKFGNKSVIISSPMSIDEYNLFLSSIDIAVFNHNRQQGVGNLTYLFQSGAKIYLNDDNPLNKDYKELDLPVYSVNSIPNMSFDEFSYIDKNKILYAQEKAKKIYSKDANVIEWNKIFQLAEKR